MMVASMKTSTTVCRRLKLSWDGRINKVMYQDLCSRTNSYSCRIVQHRKAGTPGLFTCSVEQRPMEQCGLGEVERLEGNEMKLKASASCSIMQCRFLQLGCVCVESRNRLWILYAYALCDLCWRFPFRIHVRNWMTSTLLSAIRVQVARNYSLYIRSLKYHDAAAVPRFAVAPTFGQDLSYPLEGRSCGGLG